MLNLIPMPLKAVSGEGKVTPGKIVSDYANVVSYYKKFFNNANGVPVKFTVDNDLQDEGYILDVSKKEITIAAKNERGAFYAIISLCELAVDGEVPIVTITDAPQYVWRGFMLDCARHFWSIDEIKNILHIMASIKLNKFHWHLTDDQGWRIEIKKYPLLTQKGSIRKKTQISWNNAVVEDLPYGEGLWYSQEQIKEIVALAKTLNIEVIPEIDMPGHLVAAISCYPYLSCEGSDIDVSVRWGVLDDIGCCGNDAFYDFVKDILNEVCELFPSNYFHIGGDEVPKTKWKKCPKCQAKMKEVGCNNENELQGYFNNFVMNYIATKGKNLIGWNEILDASVLNKDVIIQWWTPTHGKQLAIDWVAQGGKAILSHHNSFYMDHSFSVRPLSKTYNFVYSDLGITDRKNVVGIEAPQWVEYIRTKAKFDFNTFPRMMALAEAAWTKDEIRDYNNFEIRLENLRSHYEKNFNIEMADKLSYQGKRVTGLFAKARGWNQWRLNANGELEAYQAEKIAKAKK